MLKRLYLLISVLAFLTLDAFAQTVENLYGNLFWITDDVTHFSTQNFIGPSLRGYPVHNPQFTSEQPADTSAYSHIQYDLGGNANQRLQATLDRPLSKSTRFFFDLDRQSYPGWMTSSFARSTDLSSGVTYHQDQGLNVVVNGGVFSRDREMNGGLIGSNYGFANDGFSALANDVWFTNAFIRDQQLAISGDVHYAMGKGDTSRFYLGFRPRLARERFEFESSSDDSLYYNSFDRTLGLETLADSSQLLRAENEAYLKYHWTPDSLRSFSIAAWYGIDVYGYFSNALQTDFVNNRLGGQLNVSIPRFVSKTELNAIFQGFNAGDLALSSAGQLTLASPDSNRARSALLIYSFNGVINRAPLLYERYRSLIDQRSLDLNRMTKLNASLSYKQQSTLAHVELGVEASYLIGWTYFDDQMNVQQRNAPLTLIAPFLRLAYQGDFVEAEWQGRYQFHDRSKVYSLPDWVTQGYLGLRFPLFKKRIFMHAGVDGWYFSGYLARGYLPIYDAFFVQNERRFEPYLQLNPKLSAQIQTVNVSLSYMNVNYGFTSDSPLVAPGFPSVPRFFMMSINWKFKN